MQADMGVRERDARPSWARPANSASGLPAFIPVIRGRKSFTLNPAHHRRWQANREHCQSAAYKTAQRRRFVEEGRFGLTKTNHLM